MDLDNSSHLSQSPEKCEIRGSPKKMEVLRRSKARPISHLGIPEVFQESAEATPSSAGTNTWTERRSPDLTVDGETLREHREAEAEDVFLDDGSSMKSNILSASPILETGPSASNISAYQRKRFSMPAIALQTTQVTARPNLLGDGLSKRYSLVLGGKYKAPPHVQTHDSAGEMDASGEVQHGIAAARLMELLERGKANDD